jgi:DNA-binding CsgD family transcriptional regulator
MNYINVIIADLSQLSRLGLISLLNRMKYPFHIREVPSPDKLAVLLVKDQTGLFIMTNSFLNKCPHHLIHTMQVRSAAAVRILIHDTDLLQDPPLQFAEIIDMAEHDKVFIRKLEKQLSLIDMQKQEPDTEDLSDREKEVLRLVAIGLTNKEIGDKLFISAHTVITHRKNITAKLGIKTIAGLTMYALINRLIVPEDKTTSHDR